MTIVCSECGHQNDDDSDFCSSCGEPLEWTGVRVGAEEPEPAPEAVATVVVPPPAPEAPAPAPEAPPAPAPEAPAAPPVEAPVASAPPAPAPAPEAPPKPKKMPRIGRKEKEAAASAPPAPPAAPPGPPPARPATPPPTPPAPPAPETRAPSEPEAPLAPPTPAPVAETKAPPAKPAAPPGPGARPPAPRVPEPPIPPVEDEEAEAARLAAEEEERRAEQAKRLVVPVEQPPEPKPVVVAPVVAAPVEVKLTWWQRLVRWFKRVILRQKPAAPVVAAAAAAPVVAATAAPEAPAPAAPAVGARAPAAQKPGEEVQRRQPKAVREEEPVINPGDLICTQCGTGNNPNNKFCKRCGSSLAEAEVAKKPSWWKRFFGFFRFRKKKRYAAGERRKRQDDGGQKKSIFWIFQSGIFKIIGLVTVVVIILAVAGNWRGPIEARVKDNYHRLHDLILPGFKHVTPVSATASSSLKTHLPKLAIDGVTNTSWISKPTKHDGVLQTITVHFQSPIRVGKVGIRNGDQTTDKTYVTQARLHTALIFFFTGKGKRIVGKAKRCTFDDKPDFQTCSVDVKDVGFIKIRAISTYKSQKGNSLAIAEIEPLKKT